MESILKMRGISKRFPGVKALDRVDFELFPGEVHALIGENGAGKSTLMKVLTGIYRQDEGEITLKGRPFAAKNPKDAQEHGVSMIFQEFNLLPHLTVAENIFVAREPRKMHNLLIDDRTMIRKTQALMDSLGLNISPTRVVSQLSVAEMQMVEIAKALESRSDVLVLDEPTSALAEHEVKKLFDILRRLREQQVAIIYISHRLEEFNKIVDRVTVLRDGRYIATRDWKDITLPEMVAMMVGRSITEQYPRRSARIGEVVLEARNFVNRKLKGASLSVRSGEVVGVAGMMGAGRTEFVRAIFGADPIRSGELLMNGRRIEIRSPADAIANNIAYLPEDRKKDGLLLDQSVEMNILLASLNLCARRGVIDDRMCAQIVKDKIRDLTVKTPSARQLAKFLSGGNQQKVLLARWLCLDSRVIIFDEPTRGIDVGAKYEVYSLINRMAEAGAAVIMVSSEMPEVLGMSDRIVVMYEGSLVGELSGAEASQERILNMASNITESALEGSL